MEVPGRPRVPVVVGGGGVSPVGEVMVVVAAAEEGEVVGKVRW